MPGGAEVNQPKTQNRWTLQALRRSSLSLILGLAFLCPFLFALSSSADQYNEWDYSGGFSTDFFFPYVDYNEKDGVIPGLDWQASSDMGVHRLGARAGIGTESGKEQVLLGYTYLGLYPAIGVNLFDKNTFFEDISSGEGDEKDWLREVGGRLFVNWPFDFYHRISLAYHLESVELQDETTRLNSISVSLVRDTAEFFIIEPIYGTLLNLTAQFGDEALGSELNFQSYTGVLHLFANHDLRQYFSFGKRLVAALRLQGGVKKDDIRFFHLGGSDSLRGYNFHEFFGEKMWAAGLELRYPAWVIRRTITAWDAFHFHQLLVLAFVDSGEIWSHYEDDDSISGVDVGVGAGVRFEMFILGKLPFVVGLDIARSVTDRDRETQSYLVLGLGI